jgi:hypothetical protein
MTKQKTDPFGMTKQKNKSEQQVLRSAQDDNYRWAKPALDRHPALLGRGFSPAIKHHSKRGFSP